MENDPQKESFAITAIFAWNDDTAMVTLHVAHNADCFIPNALSVIGIDDAGPLPEIILFSTPG